MSSTTMSEKASTSFDYQERLNANASMSIERNAIATVIDDCNRGNDGETRLILDLDGYGIPLEKISIKIFDMSNVSTNAVLLDGKFQFKSYADAKSVLDFFNTQCGEGTSVQIDSLLLRKVALPNGQLVFEVFSGDSDVNFHFGFGFSGSESEEPAELTLVNKMTEEQADGSMLRISPYPDSLVTIANQLTNFCVTASAIAHAIAAGIETPHKHESTWYHFRTESPAQRQQSIELGKAALVSVATSEHDSREDLPESVRFSQIIGYESQKKDMLDMIALFKNSDVSSHWGITPPRGLILHGPPGTGKTTLANAFANELDAHFITVSTTQVNEKWVGSSARNLEKFFDQAEELAPELVVLCFDEIDSIIGSSGNAGVDSGVLGIFKTRMTELRKNIFVIGTTNNPGLIDDAVLRSGRFDEKLAIPSPNEAERRDIFSSLIATSDIIGMDFTGRHTSDYPGIFTHDIDAAELARLADDFSGADITEVLRRAKNKKALHEIRTGEVVPISQADLVSVIRTFHH